MLVLGQKLLEMIEQGFLKTFLKIFCVYFKQRCEPVALQQFFIAFREDWRDGDNLPVFLSLPEALYVLHGIVQNSTDSFSCLLIEDG